MCSAWFVNKLVNVMEGNPLLNWTDSERDTKSVLLPRISLLTLWFAKGSWR